MSMMSFPSINNHRVLLKSLVPPILLLLFVFAGNAVSQMTYGRNNPYSPSPARKTATDSAVTAVSSETDLSADARVAITRGNERKGRPTGTGSLLTEVYKVGVGDVLLVDLKNSSQGSGYYTVRANGTIDYPLAGENVPVVDKTADAIKTMLRSAITLFPDPDIDVTVREYCSHRATVSGMVNNSGGRSLQREAIPMFVIRADAVVDPKATMAVIIRGSGNATESYDLHDKDTDNVLVYPGDTVEFTDRHNGKNAGYYYIGGQINSSGQKQLSSGMTLYQAVVASGGSKGNPKKAIIRRKNDRGVLDIIEHNLRAIKDGKVPDPALASGDIVEIRN